MGNPKHSEGGLRLEVGKRYVSEKGAITNELEENDAGGFDEVGWAGYSWLKNGDPSFAYGNTVKRYGRLIREYIESPKGEEVGGPAAPELLPCPFCGAKAYQHSTANLYSCSTEDCPANHGWVTREGWNQRPAPSGLSPAVLTLEQAEKLVDEFENACAELEDTAHYDTTYPRIKELRLRARALLLSHLTGKGGKL